MALSWAQVKASQSLLALKVNGADLSLDHGFPVGIEQVFIVASDSPTLAPARFAGRLPVSRDQLLGLYG